MNTFPDFSILPEPEVLPALTNWIARAIIEAPEELRRVLYKVDISEAKAREAAATENGPRALPAAAGTRTGKGTFPSELQILVGKPGCRFSMVTTGQPDTLQKGIS